MGIMGVVDSSCLTYIHTFQSSGQINTYPWALLRGIIIASLLADIFHTFREALKTAARTGGGRIFNMLLSCPKTSFLTIEI